jgi:hypothetical protein
MSSCVFSVSFAWNGSALRPVHHELQRGSSSAFLSPSSTPHSERDHRTTVTVRDGPPDSESQSRASSAHAADKPPITLPNCEASSTTGNPYFIVEIDAPYFGDTPPPGAVRGQPYDELWNHEVVELFIVHTASAAMPPTHISSESAASSSNVSASANSAAVDSSQITADAAAAVASASTPVPTPHYLELELSPHGAHLVLQLDNVRRVRASQLPLPYAHAHIDGDRWRGAFFEHVFVRPPLVKLAI